MHAPMQCIGAEKSASSKVGRLGIFEKIPWSEMSTTHAQSEYKMSGNPALCNLFSYERAPRDVGAKKIPPIAGHVYTIGGGSWRALVLV